MWRIVNVESGVDLGEYEAESAKEALAFFAADLDEEISAPVVAEKVEES